MMMKIVRKITKPRREMKTRIAPPGMRRLKRNMRVRRERARSVRSIFEVGACGNLGDR